MTLQKAMRVRSELKKSAENIQTMLKNVSYTLKWKENKPTEEELKAKREEKLYALDGMTFVEAANKLLAITDACAEINMKIEEVNSTGHNLLYKESCLKSKLAFVDNCIARERRIEAETTESYLNDSESEFVSVRRKSSDVDKIVVTETKVYNYPIVGEDDFGMKLVDLRKKYVAELEEVRDELAAFNATAKVDYELPDGLLQ